MVLARFPQATPGVRQLRLMMVTALLLQLLPLRGAGQMPTGHTWRAAAAPDDGGSR